MIGSDTEPSTFIRFQNHIEPTLPATLADLDGPEYGRAQQITDWLLHVLVADDY
jgi:hypothetical protein